MRITWRGTNMVKKSAAGTAAASTLPTLVITIDTATRLWDVRVQHWEGVSPGMMVGLELAIQKAVHQYYAASLTKERKAEFAATAAALREQSGDGRVTSNLV
jgi:hypothetical protein